MAHGARAALQQSAVDREAACGRVVEVGEHAHQRSAIEQLRADAVQEHDVALAGERIELALAMGEPDLAALRQHDVVVEGVGQALPELQREFEELGVAGQLVVRAHQRGVAPDIARADAGLLEHRHVVDAVVGGQVIGGGEAMAAAADDDHVIARFGTGRAPGRAPGLAGERMPEQGEGRVAR